MIQKYILLLGICSFLYGNDTKIESFSMNNNDIEIISIYPKYVFHGEKIVILGQMKNKYRDAYMGGLTLSFPQFTYIQEGFFENTFETIKSYSPPTKIYSGILKKNIRSKNYMIEGWENRWNRGLTKQFYIELTVPYNIKELIVNIRGVLLFGKSKKYRTEIKLPLNSPYIDQQGYPVASFSIPIYKKESRKIKTEKKHLPPIKKKDSSTGTGFFVNPNTLITNEHVVSSCNNIMFLRNGITFPAQLKFVDKTNDLAILSVEAVNKSFLKFRSGKSIRVGESIITMGYPFGKLLGSSIKLTLGNISALTGLMNDTRTLQLTAPVQAGNSGGPLLDNTNSIVGVIYAKLAERYSAENVNLAIKASLVTMFLDIHNIEYSFDTEKIQYEVVDIADKAKESIVQIICNN